MTPMLTLIIAAAAPHNEGNFGAGEGAAWPPQGELLYTGDGHIHRRARMVKPTCPCGGERSLRHKSGSPR